MEDHGYEGKTGVNGSVYIESAQAGAIVLRARHGHRRLSDMDGDDKVARLRRSRGVILGYADVESER
jgi:hypothetical protein